MIKVNFAGYTCIVRKREYGNGRIALCLEDAYNGQPVATATINLPNEALQEGETIIKDYSENAGILDCLIEAGIVKPTGDYASSAWIDAAIVKVLI